MCINKHDKALEKTSQNNIGKLSYFILSKNNAFCFLWNFTKHFVSTQDFETNISKLPRGHAARTGHLSNIPKFYLNKSLQVSKGFLTRDEGHMTCLHKC